MALHPSKKAVSYGMRRLSRKEIRAELEEMKAKNDKPLIPVKPKNTKLAPKQSSKRIRKQGSN
ncbi:hypothetical protein C0431_06500 [bacterium]|jgi:hypothetical protein|nr:hypothetical protein [bacterium]